jgi:hypothetical protein
VSLSIVIVNWNSKELLRKCLVSLRDTCADLKLQIVVVDGGSFDGCAEMVGLDFPEVEFVQSPSNIGFGRANNLGVERVTGDALLLLNPDTEVRPGCVQTLFKELSRLPDAGILGARLENADGSIQPTSVHVLPTPIIEAFRADVFRRLIPSSRLGGHAIHLTSKVACQVEAVSGACMMMRTDVFRQVGGFTEDYFMYAEDMDLCLKVHRLGLKNYFVPDARLQHEEGGCSAVQPTKLVTLMLRAAVYRYMLVNYGSGSALLHRGAIFLATTVKLLLAGPLLILTGSVLQVRLRRSFEQYIAIVRWSVGLEAVPRVGQSWPSTSPDVSFGLRQKQDCGSARNEAVS